MQGLGFEVRGFGLCRRFRALSYAVTGILHEGLKDHKP